MFEYIALGIPIVISRTAAVEHDFSDDSLCFFEAGDETALADALFSLYRDIDKRISLATRATEVYEGLYAKSFLTYKQLIMHLAPPGS